MNFSDANEWWLKGMINKSAAYAQVKSDFGANKKKLKEKGVLLYNFEFTINLSRVPMYKRP